MPCKQLANVDALWGLAGLVALETLRLDLHGCKQLANVDGLWGLAGLVALETLALNLRGCSDLANVDGLQGLAGLVALRSPKLKLSLTLDNQQKVEWLVGQTNGLLAYEHVNEYTAACGFVTEVMKIFVQ